MEYYKPTLHDAFLTSQWYDSGEFFISEEQLNEMSNLKRSETGLPKIIYVSTKYAVHNQHGPRIKVSFLKNRMSERTYVITLPNLDVIGLRNEFVTNREISEIKEWATENMDMLMRYWNNRISYDEFKHEIIKFTDM